MKHQAAVQFDSIHLYRELLVRGHMSGDRRYSCPISSTGARTISIFFCLEYYSLGTGEKTITHLTVRGR